MVIEALVVAGLAVIINTIPHVLDYIVADAFCHWAKVYEAKQRIYRRMFLIVLCTIALTMVFIFKGV